MSLRLKTLFARGSLTVSDYLTQSGLQSYLDQLGFYVDGFGCTACIGNSGSLVPSVEQAMDEQGLVAVSVLSGNRNFSGRVQQKLGFNYLASPPLVLAYALAGKIEIDQCGVIVRKQALVTLRRVDVKHPRLQRLTKGPAEITRIALKHQSAVQTESRHHAAGRTGTIAQR